MSDVKKIDNEVQEPKKRQRGRPRKEPPKQINEADTRLEMSSPSTNTICEDKKEEKITIPQIQHSLTQFYNNLLGASSLHAGWDGGIFNLNMYNPFLQNQRLKMINTYPSELDTETLTKIISNPGGSEISLRGEGWSLSSSQYLYYKILRLAADIPMFKYYKIPELLENKNDYSKPAFIREDIFVDDWLNKFDVVNTLKKTSLEVKREGKPTYLLRNSISTNPDGQKTVNYTTFQKLPSNYVKLTGIGEHGYIASLNMMMFLNPAFSLEQYPDYIRDIWDALMTSGAIYENPEYKNGKPGVDKYKIDINTLKNFKYTYTDSVTGVTDVLSGNITIEKPESNGKAKLKAVNYMYWVQLPQDVCYTFCSDASNAWAIPDTSGLFLGLRELTDYDTLAGLIQSTPLTALLTAEAESIQNPNPGQNQTILAPETIAGFQDKFNSSTSTNLEAFFAPLKNFKLLSLPNVPNSSDITSNATKNFISRAGLAGLLPVTDKPSVAQIKGSQLIEEAACDFVTKQFESVINFIVNNLISCEYKWKVVLWGNIFTFDNEVKLAKEMVMSGAVFALPKLASAYNMNLRDVKATDTYINTLDIYTDFRTITQVQQAKNNNLNTGSNNSVGRPQKSESEIDNDNTAASKESGLDTADMRDFNAFDGSHCIICGEESEEPLCENCKEIYVEGYSNE